MTCEGRRGGDSRQRFVTIARIVKTRGIRGEVVAVLLTHFPERFKSVGDVQVLVSGVGHLFKLKRHWFHKGRVILKFEGLNRPEEAVRLVGGEVQIPEEERVEPPEDVYFHSDLIGCRVRQSGDDLGEVVDVFETGGVGANLVVRTLDGGEAMIPLASRFILNVDVPNKTIVVQAPPQLLELGRPGRKETGGVKTRRAGGKRKDRRENKPQ